MPHLLYNHRTHSWDQPDPGHAWSDPAQVEESPDFGARGRRILARLAWATAALFAGFVLWGMLAGLFLEISQK